MTKLEQIALDKLTDLIISAKDRCSAKNIDRMGSERLFIEKELRESLDIIEAIQESNETNEKRIIG